MNYLVPLDFSDHSKTAAEYAAGLTKVWDGNLHLSHIIVPIEDEPAYLSVKTLNMKRNTVFEMSAYQETLRRKFNVRTSCDLLRGTITTQIRKTAAIEKSNLIVMGMQGLTGLRNFLYGSNTMAVVEETSVPVLVLPKGIAFKPYEHIIYLTNFERADLNDIESLIKISLKFNSRLTILSVNSTVDDEQKAKFIEAIDGEKSESISFKEVYNPGGITDGLLKFVGQNGVDLVSLSNKRRRLVRKIAGRSLTGEFIFNASVPVLFFPS